MTNKTNPLDVIGGALLLKALVLAKLPFLLASVPLYIIASINSKFNFSLPINTRNAQYNLEDLSEYLAELPTNLGLGSDLDTIMREVKLALQDLDAMMDEEAVFAVANIRGEAQGELYLVQAPYATDHAVTVIAGALSGLEPGVHNLQVTLKEDISNDCANVGEAYSDDSDGIFLANEEGEALVVVRVLKAPLRGTDTVLGRSVVITARENPDNREACGVIVHTDLFQY